MFKPELAFVKSNENSDNNYNVQVYLHSLNGFLTLISFLKKDTHTKYWTQVRSSH